MPLPTFEAQIEESITALHKLENIPSDDVHAVISPYRICPIGAHIDHQGGDMLARPIATGTALSFAPLNTPEVRLHSAHFGQSVFQLGTEPDLQHWARYAEAAALALARIHPLKRGLTGFVNGTLIGAGLSSSASVGLAYVQALAAVNEIYLTNEELIELQLILENEILGLKIGILDPAAIVHGTKDNLLFIESQTGTVRPVANAADKDTFSWLVAYSGVSRQLIQSGFNNRVEECHEASALLQPGAKRLGEISQEKFATRQHILPEHLRRRAAHFFSEVERVHNGEQAWLRGDLETFGALMNASCESSIRSYESGSPVIIDLHYIVRNTSGVYGSRFSGGGYGGCVVALIRSDSAHEATEHIAERFAGMHPEVAEHASVHIVAPDDGLRFAEK